MTSALYEALLGFDDESAAPNDVLEPVGVRPGERECVVVDVVDATLEFDADAEAVADADAPAAALLP